MIAVDGSALVAILLEEPEAEQFKSYLLAHPGARLSPEGYWEGATRLRIVRVEGAVAELNAVIEGLRIEIAPASATSARIASTAERDFGKRTRAKLNLGDCFAYALAKELDAPLLFKGDDFTTTDVKSALPA